MSTPSVGALQPALVESEQGTCYNGTVPLYLQLGMLQPHVIGQLRVQSKRQALRYSQIPNQQHCSELVFYGGKERGACAKLYNF